MKKNIVSKLLSITLASCLIIGGVSFGGIKSVNAAGKSDTLYLKASDLNRGKVSYYDTENERLDLSNIDSSYENVCIEIDELIKFTNIESGDNLTFLGDQEVSMGNQGAIIDNMTVRGDLTVNKGVTIYAGSSYPTISANNLYFYGKLKADTLKYISAYESAHFSKASIEVKQYCDYFLKNCQDIEILDSEINLANCNYNVIDNCNSTKITNSSINCEYVDGTFLDSDDVDIENSDIVVKDSEYGIYSGNYGESGNLSVSGNIDISSEEYALYSSGNIEINGGNIVLKSSDSNDIFAKGDFTYNGGSISAKKIKVEGDIIPGDNYYIKSEDGASSLEFEKASDLKDATISGVEDKTYTGQPITQSPVLTFNDTELTEGEDYTVSYSDNTAVGTATITFKGVKGSPYCGETSVTFKIAEVKKEETNMKEERESRDGKPDETGLTVDKTENQSAKNQSNDAQSAGSQSNDAQSAGSQSNDAQSAGSQGNEAQPSEEVKRQNEWVNGQWYDADGNASYAPKGQWKEDASGYWFEDESGWYPVSQWQKIDGKWYYFTADGYMDYSEYRDGYWLQADGSWDEVSSNGRWCQDSTGWWYEDDGWYPKNQNLWIDGVKYYFNAEGYWK